MNKSKLSSTQISIFLLVGTVALLTSAAALNGGTALTSSSFDSIVSTVKGMLASTMVLSFAFVAMFAAVWQITHGKGYGMLSMVLGILAVAILGPTIVTSLATATRDPQAIIQHATALTVPASFR